MGREGKHVMYPKIQIGSFHITMYSLMILFGLIAFAVLFFLRKRLFLKMFTVLFTGILDSGTSSDKWKTIALGSSEILP